MRLPMRALLTVCGDSVMSAGDAGTVTSDGSVNSRLRLGGNAHMAWA